MFRGTNFIEMVNCLGSVNLLTGRGASANFLFERRQAHSAGDENCQGKRICHPKRNSERTG